MSDDKKGPSLEEELAKARLRAASEQALALKTEAERQETRPDPGDTPNEGMRVDPGAELRKKDRNHPGAFTENLGRSHGSRQRDGA